MRWNPVSCLEGRVGRSAFALARWQGSPSCPREPLLVWRRFSRRSPSIRPSWSGGFLSGRFASLPGIHAFVFARLPHGRFSWPCEALSPSLPVSLAWKPVPVLFVPCRNHNYPRKGWSPRRIIPLWKLIGSIRYDRGWRPTRWYGKTWWNRITSPGYAYPDG